MARKKSWNTFENQAKLSVILAVVGGVGVLAAMVLLGRNFTNLQTFWVAYNPRTMWLPMLAAFLFLALSAGGAGFFIGLNSAGQRRNTRSRLAWIGFFASAGVLMLAVCAAIFFYFARYKVTF